LKDVLKIALLSAAVELIRHLDLSNVLSEEFTQFFSGFPALKGSKILVDCSYVPSCFVCHIVIMICALSACIVAGGSIRAEPHCLGISSEWAVIRPKLSLLGPRKRSRSHISVQIGSSLNALAIWRIEPSIR
jgi:hypothetical protein